MLGHFGVEVRAERCIDNSGRTSSDESREEDDEPRTGEEVHFASSLHHVILSSKLQGNSQVCYGKQSLRGGSLRKSSFTKEKIRLDVVIELNMADADTTPFSVSVG